MFPVGAYMAGIRWVESRGDYAAVNDVSGAFGAYQMLPGNIDYFMAKAGVVGDIADPDVQDAVARWWFLHLFDVYDGNWMLVSTAWHMGAGATNREILEPLGYVYDGSMWPGAGSVTLEQIEAARPGESVYVAGVMEVAMGSFPRMHPDAIDVTNGSDAKSKVPVKGKTWHGGSGNRKLVLHTIEAAEPWTIGWPRYWPNVKAAPHFYLNAADKNDRRWGTNRWPDKNWLYQTLPLDVAGYALRSNATEDDKYIWQVEIAGRAANTPDYPDPFYQAIADLCDWFVAECGVAEVVFDIQTGGRISQSALDKFSGIIGHRNVGKGVDTHTDPGRYFDQKRLRKFMGATPPPPPKEQEMPPLPVRQGDGYKDMPADYPFPKDWKDATWKSVIAEYQRDFNRFPEVKVKLTTDGAYGPKTSAALDAILGSISILNGTFLSGNGWSIVRAELRAMEGGGEHGHPDLTAKDAALEAKIAVQAGHDHDDRDAEHAALLGRYNGHHHDVPAGTVPTRRTEGPNT